MTDRELLELAAKAVGYTGFSGDDYQGPYFCIPSDPEIPRSEPKIFQWLTEDGDALRLAVRLKLKIVQSETATICFYGFACYVSESIESNGICRYESTRRAIVRAAAEIGKTM